MIDISQGKILIAEPFMEDPNFKRAVIAICDYSRDEGSFGFVLNKPIHMNITDLIGDFPDFKGPVYYGGPVGNDTVHYMHDCGEILEESILIKKGIYWGGNFKKLKLLIENKLIKPHNIRFFVGYSGWSAGQLEEELNSQSWVVSDLDSNYVFNIQSHKLWAKTLQNKGNAFTVIAQMPEVISVN